MTCIRDELKDKDEVNSVRIYTKTGDEGETGLVGGARIAKDDARIEAYGTIDELNAAIGVVRSVRPVADLDPLLAAIQGDLFSLGAELASPAAGPAKHPAITDDQIGQLETSIDSWEADLPPLHNFILPGGSLCAGHLHLARVICRRAERRVVTLARTDYVAASVIPFLNRLSDLLFVLARAENAKRGVADTIWKSDR
ncbi:MAG: cob(I)yrinic acid a,c-diamide adenosyltransferase [Pirellulaceae bacterium]|nr:cob(I)yrinic acid a,c-diamide adenosyltransferase [Pirellulaceae bacterium]